MVTMESTWKLGEDMFLCDNLLDPITFDDLVLTIRCNCREIDEQSVRKTAKEILWMRLEDFEELLKRNVKEIIAEVKKQKGME